MTNGEYIGNWIQTSCCTTDYCNQITTSAAVTANTAAPAVIVSSCYVGTEPILNMTSCPAGSTDLCKVNAIIFFCIIIVNNFLFLRKA